MGLLEERVPADHPLHKVRAIVNAALTALDAAFAGLYSVDGRPSIPPERLLRAALIQVLFSIRSERQLMDQPQYNLLFRWFVGLGHRRSGLGADRVQQEPRQAFER
jgi:transposase